MIIYGLSGSPKKDGNTNILIEGALSAARELGAKTELFNVQEVISGLDEPFCDACSKPCNKSCYEGTKVEEIFEELKTVDGLILGSPVYFGTVSAQLKSFWDLTRDLRKGLYLMNVVGGAIAVGHSRFGGQETTIKAIHDMMMIQGMIIVGDGYNDDAGHQGAAAQDPVEIDGDDIKRARILGHRVASVADVTRRLRKKN